MAKEPRFRQGYTEMKGAVIPGSERIAPAWEKGSVPIILPKHRAAMAVLFDLDAAETQREWDWALAQLTMHLLRAALPAFGGENEPSLQHDAIMLIGTRIAAGFKPPGGRPSHVIAAREDAFWLSDLAEDTTLPEAIAYLAKIRGISEVLARARVNRVEREIQRKFLREKPFGRGRS